jgi:hypothetical protein
MPATGTAFTQPPSQRKLEWFFQVGMDNEIKFNPFMVLAISDSQLSKILFAYSCENSV